MYDRILGCPALGRNMNAEMLWPEVWQTRARTAAAAAADDDDILLAAELDIGRSPVATL